MSSIRAAAISLFLLCSSINLAAPLQTFTLTEWLDHDWRHELVAIAAPGDLPAKLAIRQEDQALRPAQLHEGRLYSLLDLPAAAKPTYEVVASAAQSSLAIQQTAETLEITNDLVGVRLAVNAEQAASGPIAAIRLADGTWTGGGSLIEAPAIEAYEVEVTATGPVFAEVLLTYRLATGSWTLRVRVIEGEPVIRLSEQMNVKSPFTWTMGFTGDWGPDHVLYRHGASPSKKPRMGVLAEPLQNQTYRLYPWLEWWQANAASFCSLFKGSPGVTYHYEKRQITPLSEKSDQAIPLEQGPHYGPQPVLFMAAGQGAAWVAPGNRIKPIRIHSTDAGPTLTIPVDGLGREWLLGTCALEDAIRPDHEISLPQRMLIKHLETPLQLVLDMDLELPADAPADYPRLFIQREDIEEIGRRFPKPSENRKQWIWDFLYNPSPEGEEELGQKARHAVLRSVRTFTEHLESGDPAAEPYRRPSQTAFTHHVSYRVNAALFNADLALSAEMYTPEERQRLRAQLAFIATKMASPHFYSLERNFRANPNMTTMRHATVGMLGCILWQHPRAQAWVDLGIGEINRQIEHWIDDNGGWLESPLYQIYIMDGMMLLRAAHYAGFSDDVYSEKLLSTILYLAKITTPPDPRWDDVRHMPPAGNTYRLLRSCIFSIFAKLHHERHPEIADALQWTWYEMNKPMFLSIGGDTIFNRITEFLVADFEPSGPPKWESELFPKASAMLRHGFPGPRETQFYLLQGPFMEHYDHDRGSFSLWGKGRPLSLDWGYHGRMPGWQHNMVPGIPGIGRVTEFEAGPRFDYLRSTQRGWSRQILFVKREDPMEPNYFVIRDQVPADKAYEWWFWLYTLEPPRLVDGLITMTGHHDVDLDIWLPDRWHAQFERYTPRELAELEPPETPGQQAETPGEGPLPGFNLEQPKPTSSLKTHSLTIPAVQGHPDRRGWKVNVPLTQEGLKLKVPAGDVVVWVLYPRLRNQSKPRITVLDDQARLVRVTTEAGTDTLLLSPEPDEYQQDGISLQGVAAVHPPTTKD